MDDALVEAVRPTFKTSEAVNEWLQNQATLLLQQIAARQESKKDVVAVASPEKKHSAWVQSMAQYRRLAPMDEKTAMLDSLDERFG
ncbi:MAG: hypothetical protein MJZ60_04920 [Bacteroidaceae bacterium]|nr:hypothetical protein [Bacteroidaceae bacterium]